MLHVAGPPDPLGPPVDPVRQQGFGEDEEQAHDDGDGVPYELAFELTAQHATSPTMDQNVASAQPWRRRWIRTAATSTASEVPGV